MVPLPAQQIKTEKEDFSEYGYIESNLILIVLCGGLLLTLICQGSLIPVYALFETIQLISHLPLVVPDMPSRLVSFLEPINDLMRANFGTSANNYFCEKFSIEQDDGQVLDQNFRDFGY